MRIRAAFITVTAVLLTIGGCDTLAALFTTNVVTVRLVNSTAYPVLAQIRYSDQEDIGLILPGEWEERTETIPAGTSRTIVEPCDRFHAITIEDADLLLLGPLGPEADTRIYLDGVDFDCGDTIVFTFSYDDLDFDIQVTYE